MDKEFFETLDRWSNILAKVQIICPKAFIGGGAMRDLYLMEVPDVKDVDIFTTPVSYEILLELFPQDKDVINISEGREYQVSNTTIQQVYEFLVGSETINVIVCDDSENFMNDQLERFDIGICKIGYDGRLITTHRQYLEDFYYKRICIRTSSYIEGSLARLNRIGKKYPTWEKVNLYV